MKKIAFVAAALASVAALPATAADFSFSGSLTDPNQALLFDFTVGANSTVTLRTYSYAGGTNVAGQTFAAGGFDPILALFDASGLLIDDNDDGGCPAVPQDPATGACFDTLLQLDLAPGRYTLAVTQFPNFAVGPNLSDGFENDATGFDGRTPNFAFDVLGVDLATGPGGIVPEPESWALMIGGFGMAGGALRRRQRTSVTYA